MVPALEYVWKMRVSMSRFSEIFNAIVIDKFNGKQRIVTFAGNTVIEDDENWEDNNFFIRNIYTIDWYMFIS